MQDQSRIKKTVTLNEIPWDQLCATHADLHQSSISLRADEVRAFLAHIRKPLNLYWFLNRRLKFHDNRVASALCTFFGGDVIELIDHRIFTPAGIKFEYRLNLTFEPKFKAVPTASRFGTVAAVTDLRCYRFHISVSNIPTLLIVNSLALLLALIFNILLLGLFFYGTAIFVLFLEEPWEVTKIATRRLEIGLGLLGYLLVLTVLSRRVLLDLFRRRKNRKPDGN